MFRAIRNTNFTISFDYFRAIVRKQCLRQYELEKAEESLSAKSRQKQELQQQITAAEVNINLKFLFVFYVDSFV